MINSNLQSAIVKIFTNSFFFVTSGICCCKVRGVALFLFKGKQDFPHSYNFVSFVVGNRQFH